MSTGRALLYELARRLALSSRGEVALMPAYVAEGALRPFLSAGVRVVFYRLLPTLHPDLEDLADMLGREPSARVVLVIHPFGIPVDVGPIKALAGPRGALVVEDCAQGLFTSAADGGPLGRQGDLALYSLNKFLPVSDGAVLVSRCTDVDLATVPDPLAVPDPFALACHDHLLAMNDLLAQIEFGQLAEHVLAVTGSLYAEYYRRISGALAPVAVSHDTADRIESLSCSALITRRGQNARALTSLLRAARVSVVFPELPPGAVPWAVPVLVPPEQREDTIRRARERGVLLGTLAARWNFVPPGQESRFPVETQFLKSHLLLPINERYAEEHLVRVRDALASIPRRNARC